jgi:hypothetical protein
VTAILASLPQREWGRVVLLLCLRLIVTKVSNLIEAHTTYNDCTKIRSFGEYDYPLC